MGKGLRTVLLTLLILTLSVFSATLAYLHFFATDEVLSGEWTADLDVTEQAAAQALCWLRDIEAVSLSLEEMESYMQGLNIQVELDLEQTSRSQGQFRSRVVPESYEACKEAAYEAFALAFQKLLTKRLHMAGYMGGTDRESMEALVTEAFGMSTVSYLMSCGPALLPSLEELQAAYDGSGSYEVAEGVLIRQFDAGGAVTRESYLRKDAVLVLSEEDNGDPAGALEDWYPFVYTLKEPEAE